MLSLGSFLSLSLPSCSLSSPSLPPSLLVCWHRSLRAEKSQLAEQKRVRIEELEKASQPTHVRAMCAVLYSGKLEYFRRSVESEQFMVKICGMLNSIPKVSWRKFLWVVLKLRDL